MNEAEAMEKLAVAMNKLADKLERFQDPVIWQKVLTDAIHTMPGLGAAISASPALPAPLPGEPTERRLLVGRIEEFVHLSDEERTKLVGEIHKAIEPQLAEFSEFVRQSLQEMPAHRLKKIGEKMAAGEEPKVTRKPGCIFIRTGDEETYLAL